MLSIKKISNSQLNQDLSNLDELSLGVLNDVLQGKNAETVLQKIKHEMLVAAKSGVGVDPIRVEPLQQFGLECQTMAIINGITALGGARYLLQFGSIRDLVHKARSNALQEGSQERYGSRDINAGRLITNDSLAHYSMDKKAQEFMQLNIPIALRSTTLANPIKAVRELFGGKRFLSISAYQGRHAYTIVPISNPTEEEFVLKIDSLGESKKILSLDFFVRLLIGKRYIVDNGAESYYYFELQ